jgi:hypothetical protein
MGTLKGVETDSWANFGKETMARAHRRPKWVPIMVRRLTHSVLRIIRLYSGSAQVYLGSAQVCSPPAQVKAAGCSRPETNTEPAKEKINPESKGIQVRWVFRFLRSHADFLIMQAVPVSYARLERKFSSRKRP